MTRHIVAAIFALAGLAGAPTAGTAAEQKPGIQQTDKSQIECIARRQREGLNIRFAVHRCVNPNN